MNKPYKKYILQHIRTKFKNSGEQLEKRIIIFMADF